MAVSALLIDFGQTSPVSIAGLPPISELWCNRHLILIPGLPESGALGTLSRRALKVWCSKSQGSCGEQAVPVFSLQDFSSHHPTEWWDNRRNKKTNQDFRGDAQVYAGMRRLPGSAVPGASDGSAIQQGDAKIVSTCRKLCEDGYIREAVDALNFLVKQGCYVHNNLFYRVLNRCNAPKDLALGRQVHALADESGYEGNAFLATHLIGMYGSHGRLEEAMRVFCKVKAPSAQNWASIILAYARHGEPTQAIGLYRQMRASTVKPDNRIFVAVLKACAAAGHLTVGKDIHADICSSAIKPDIFVQTSLVDMYAKCGSLQDAQKVFDKLPHKNVVTWTAMIAGYAQQGMGQEALGLYSSMLLEGITLPNSFTFVCLLQGCASVGEPALQQGKQLHVQMKELGLQSDLVLANNLINMYAKCGSLQDAQRVFDRLPQKNVVTWTAIIGGYAQEGMGQEALSLYSRMRNEGITQPDPVTFICLLQACASLGLAALQQGKQLHVEVERQGLEADVVVGNSLVTMYAKCGSLENAEIVFNGLSPKNVVTWTAMIAGYATHGKGREALSLYSSMQQEGITPPDSVAFVCLLQACASAGEAALTQGKLLHAQIEQLGLQADVVVGASLVDMYAKCGSMEDAQTAFNGLPQKNVVTWTAMIAGYTQQGMGHRALALYSSMQQEAISAPDGFTFACLLQACASVTALTLGKQLHAQIEERGLQADVVVGSSLVNMYARCGSIEDAHHVFDSLPEKEVVAWSALIAGYARRGNSEIVFDLFYRMRQEGTLPNSITFLSVLTVCSHLGLVDKSRKYFESMTTDYGITPAFEHYTCMMDLLGRAGHLDEALQMVKFMPFQPNGAVWLTLLGACQKWSNVEVGRQAFEFAVRLDEKCSAAYLLMSNIYSAAEMWEEAKKVQERRKRIGAWKQPGTPG